MLCGKYVNCGFIFNNVFETYFFKVMLVVVFEALDFVLFV